MSAYPWPSARRATLAGATVRLFRDGALGVDGHAQVAAREFEVRSQQQVATTAGPRSAARAACCRWTATSGGKGPGCISATLRCPAARRAVSPRGRASAGTR